MKPFKFVVILASVIYFTYAGTCKMGENFYGISVENNSDKVITPFKGTSRYDTVLPPGKPPSVILSPGSSFRFTSQNSYEEMFQNLPRDTMSFFFFDYEIFSTVNWVEICENRMFLIRYELSLEDLRRLNWKVTYPPTEAMKDMKQVVP